MKKILALLFLFTNLVFAITEEEITNALKTDNVTLIQTDISEHSNSDYLNALLFLASASNSKGIVELLLKNGANIEAQDDKERTPLMYASGSNAKEVVEVLLKNGANIEAKVSNGWTPLFFPLIANSKEVEVVDLLLKNGANIEARDIYGTTPLLYASSNNAKEISELLIKNGADIEAKDILGYTPLMEAVQNKSEDIINLLLDNGANFYAKDISGRQVLDLAQGEKRKELEKLFQSKLAENMKNIKYAEDAVTIWDKELKRADEKYNEAVGLFIDYKNNTMKRIIGISVQVEIINPFGKTVYEDKFDDEVLLEPKEKMKNDTYWKFENNQFTSNEPYDLMWKMADNGTAKINTKILKVIFEDGTSLQSKPITKK